MNLFLTVPTYQICTYLPNHYSYYLVGIFFTYYYDFIYQVYFVFPFHFINYFIYFVQYMIIIYETNLVFIQGVPRLIISILYQVYGSFVPLSLQHALLGYQDIQEINVVTFILNPFVSSFYNPSLTPPLITSHNRLGAARVSA